MGWFNHQPVNKSSKDLVVSLPNRLFMAYKCGLILPTVRPRPGMILQIGMPIRLDFMGVIEFLDVMGGGHSNWLASFFGVGAGENN